MKVSEVGSNINIPFIKHHVLKGIIQYPVLYRIHLPYMDLFAWGGIAALTPLHAAHSSVVWYIFILISHLCLT